MNISDMFKAVLPGAAVPAQAAAAAVVAPAVVAPVAAPAVAPVTAAPDPAVTGGGTPVVAPVDGVVPAVPAVASAAPINPLDAYLKLFDNVEDKDKAVAPVFALESKALATAASNLNFADGIDQVIMQKAQEGDSAAMLQVMNAMMQNTYQTSLQHTAALTDKFVQARSTYDANALPELVRGQLTHQALNGTDIPDHPAVQAQLKETAIQLQKQHPTATPQWIATEARSYLTKLAEALNPKPAVDPKIAAATAETNWDEWLEPKAKV